MSATELKRSVAVLDELDNCLSNSITLANLLVDGSDIGDPIDSQTVRRAGHMIGERLRRAEKIISDGGAS
jgi:hypothetical protein